MQRLGRYQDLKPAATIDAMIHYTETLLGIHFTSVRKNRYNARCPFHADTQDRFMACVNKDDEVRFHCFGACKGDWDIYDLIMLRKNYRLRKAQEVWAAHLGVMDVKFDDGSSPAIHGPDETPEPDEPVGFVEPKSLHEKIIAALGDAANFYNELLMSNKDRFKLIWDYLSRRGVGKEIIGKFTIGYAPPYSDDQHHGRALIGGFLPHFEKGADVFDAFSNGGLFRFLNDATAKGYGYYLPADRFQTPKPVFKKLR